MIKELISYIKEIFNISNYIWIDSGVKWRSIARFKYNYEYFIHFDEFCDNSYNLYFFRRFGDIMITDLISDNSDKTFKILSNVKIAVEDFIKTHPNIEFMGFSSTDKERDDLYTLFLQNIKTANYKTQIRQMKRKKYYFLYHKDLNKIVFDFCVSKFTTEDENLKK